MTRNITHFSEFSHTVANLTHRYQSVPSHFFSSIQSLYLSISYRVLKMLYLFFFFLSPCFCEKGIFPAGFFKGRSQVCLSLKVLCYLIKVSSDYVSFCTFCIVKAIVRYFPLHLAHLERLIVRPMHIN